MVSYHKYLLLFVYFLDELDRTSWNTARTRSLIHQFGDLHGLRKYTLSGKKEVIYADMAKQVNEERGTSFTTKQIKTKWMYLKKKYEQVKQRQNKSGAAAINWLLFDDMQEVLRDVPNVSPVALGSSRKGLSLKRKVTISKSQLDFQEMDRPLSESPGTSSDLETDALLQESEVSHHDSTTAGRLHVN